MIQNIDTTHVTNGVSLDDICYEPNLHHGINGTSGTSGTSGSGTSGTSGTSGIIISQSCGCEKQIGEIDKALSIIIGENIGFESKTQPTQSTISTKLITISHIKQKCRDEINNKHVYLPKIAPFETYPPSISKIETCKSTVGVGTYSPSIQIPPECESVHHTPPAKPAKPVKDYMNPTKNSSGWSKAKTRFHY